MTKSLRKTLSGLLAALCIASTALAGTIHVPAEFLTIQAAIDAAEPGDEIIVAPGTYNEAINFNGKTIVVGSSAGPESTSIDAAGLNLPVVQIVSGENEGTTLEGFTITGGVGGSNTIGGGGIRITNSSNLTVIDCIITENNSTHGGGVSCVNSVATFIDCTITNNTATAGAGGGMRMRNSSAVTMTGCTITGNSTTNISGTGSGGGGIQSITNSTLVMTGCTVSENSSLAAGGGIQSGGGSSATNGCSLTMNDCIVTANTARRGGGIASNGSEADLIDCTFTNNASSGGGSTSVRGGALHLVDGALAAINCTFSGNTSTGGDSVSNPGGGAAWFSGSAVAMFTGCEFTGNAVSGTSNTGGAIRFIGSAGNLTLTGCTFTSNTSSSWGGAFHGQSGSTLTIDDCAFNANQCVSGGAAISHGGPVLVTNSSFTDNFTTSNVGGAVQMTSTGNLTLIDSEFTGNTTGPNGGSGAIRSSSSSPVTATRCTFTANHGAGQGGAVRVVSGTLTDCDFIGNSANDGGALTVSGTVKLRNCRFFNNSANRWGGAVYARVNSFLDAANCLLVGNATTNTNNAGSGFHIVQGALISNCTIVGNSSPTGGGGIGLGGVSSNRTIVNSILHGNSPNQIVGGGYTATYNNIQGGHAGEGNINEDPLFVDVAGGDYRLTFKSPSVDSGNTSAVPDGVFTDLDGNARVVNCIVDQGAYETQDIAGNPADLNGDGSVGVADLLVLLAAWGPCPDTGACPADLNCDGAVGVADLLILLANWG